MPYKPSWFKDDQALIANASTCGINKDGHDQYIVDRDTGERSEKIDDKLSDYVQQIVSGVFEGPHVAYRPMSELERSGILVPYYYDAESLEQFEAFIENHSGLVTSSIGDLKKKGFIEHFGGHGSPSSDQRLGSIPYIKVSDLRAGSVNINPTNLVPAALAEDFWRGPNSRLRPYDLLSPERASKNIGEFCVLMPGQERVVLTKEIIGLRATEAAPFDQFYLMWALALSVVRRQWDRIVFMQTNREDVGDRVEEIRLPLPSDRNVADSYCRPFRDYYTGLEAIRAAFAKALLDSKIEYHVFI